MKIINEYNRQVVLDTETTGFNPTGNYYEGHGIIEIGAVEIINRHITGRQFHVYINPQRLVEKSAYKIHNINNNFLFNQPKFIDIAYKFINFIKNSQLIIHNASFDIGFINYELKRNNIIINIESICSILDSLQLARKLFPGKRNSLLNLSMRYKLNIEKSIFHGALRDAIILAKVFILMTRGQIEILFPTFNNSIYPPKKYKKKYNIKIIKADENEIKSHELFLKLIGKKSFCLWR